MSTAISKSAVESETAAAATSSHRPALSVDDIKKKIRQNLLATEPKDPSKNPLWNHFLSINETDSNGVKTVHPNVSCLKCGTILSYDSARGGTSHLRRHVDICISLRHLP